MEDSLSDICAFGVEYRRAKVTPKWILMSHKQQSVKSTLQKSQDNASNVVDHTFRTDARNTKFTPITMSKITGKLIIPLNSMKVTVIVLSFLQVLYPPRHNNKSSLVMTFCWVSAQQLISLAG